MTLCRNNNPSATADETKAKSKALNEAKSELLEDYKTGFTKMPVEVIRGLQEKKSSDKAAAIERLRNIVKEAFDLKIAERGMANSNVG